MLLSSHTLKQQAARLGFAACGLSPVAPATSQADYLDRWIAQGAHAGMGYMERNRDLRLHPEGLLEGARTIISVALNYYPAQRLQPNLPHIAYYAYGKDYHFVLKERLRQLWGALFATGEPPAARFFTDSAPLLERYWAWRGGLGFIGKNSQLIIPGKGSYFFLGEIVTTLAADQYDQPQPSRCGHCTRCLDNCPTGALQTNPYRLHAAHCLSYLTIEHKGALPPAQAAQLGNRLYGCDTCQMVCPWNRFAVPTAVEEFSPSPELLSLQKEQLPTLSEAEYNRIFAQSALKRAKYEGLLRTINQLNE